MSIESPPEQGHFESPRGCGLLERRVGPAFPRPALQLWVPVIIEFPLSSYIGNPVINQFITPRNRAITEKPNLSSC